ncbi:MAG: pyridoxamine 5'-phosphate oxidase [Planctomycetes bacterium]|nr:pyridoxamine 5'-phosphate oxidase [Planctomycetota bacterium]
MNELDQRMHVRDRSLAEHELAADPMRQFHAWFDEWLATDPLEPNAMALATADASSVPSVRIVLLKGLAADGFSFFTNYESEKGMDLAANPNAALCFYWMPFERQVRVTGKVARMARKETEAYFRSRPRGSQIGAWASKQSAVLADRATLEREALDAEARFKGKDVPPPPNWGGYLLKPDTVEFWQGRSSRLHDRFRYARKGRGWVVERLYP